MCAEKFYQKKKNIKPNNDLKNHPIAKCPNENIFAKIHGINAGSLFFFFLQTTATWVNRRKDKQKKVKRKNFDKKKKQIQRSSQFRQKKKFVERYSYENR